MKFPKSAKEFPVKNGYVAVNHCAVSALYAGARAAVDDVLSWQMEESVASLPRLGNVTRSLKESFAQILSTSPLNASFVRNAAEGLGLIASSYPFEPGDQIISYVHEYPSNHYPWKVQERRGVQLILVPDAPVMGLPDGRPRGFAFDDIVRLTTSKTRIIALSHVQFTSGFACDLERIGRFCAERGIDFILDAAQSLGALPIDPERWNIAAVASSGWKWLMGPLGTGLLYTSPALRAKLEPVMAGADLMVQGSDYLNHTWSPHTDGRMFEYSTMSVSLAAGLAACLRDLQVPFGRIEVRDEIFRLQDLLLEQLDKNYIQAPDLSGVHRSGIVALTVREPDAVMNELMAQGILVSSRAGYLRVAPHISNTDQEITKTAAALNAACAKRGL